MRRLGLVCLFLAAAVIAQSPASALDSLYQQVLTPPLAQGAVIHNEIRFNWGGIWIDLRDGQLALSAPVRGHVVAAVFQGHGILLVNPPTAAEARQVNWVLRKSQVEGSFTEAVFRFSDDAAFRSALGALAFEPMADTGPLHTLLSAYAKTTRDRGDAQPARVLQALLAPRPTPLLYVEIKSVDGRRINIEYDPYQAEPSRVYWRAKLDSGVLDETWTQFAFAPQPPLAQLTPWHLGGYHLNVTVNENQGVTASTAFTIDPVAQPRTAPPRSPGLFLALDSGLRVTAVTVAGIAAPWLQPPDPGRGRNEWYTGNWLLIQLPPNFAAAGALPITVNYNSDDLLTRTPLGTWVVRPLDWYPMSPFGPPVQRATFQLDFNVGRKETVVAPGQRTRDAVQGERHISEWETGAPIVAAGFSLGEFQATTRAEHLATGQPIELTLFTRANQAGSPEPPALAASALAALNFMASNVGAYPYGTASVADAPLGADYGWPELLSLPPQPAGVNLEGRTQLAATAAAANQWWPGWVGWAAPQDEWLAQGLEAFSGAWNELATGRTADLIATLQDWRYQLLGDQEGNQTADEAGPITLGRARLSTLRMNASGNLFYKGGLIFYMLHQMMLDPEHGNSDAAFVDLMKDYTGTFGGRDPSTAEFKALVEKHMTAAMDLDHNHRMDWFFNEYVSGTGVRHLRFSARVAASSGGEAGYNVAVTISNPSHWRGLLPVYIFRDDNPANYVLRLIPVSDPIVHTTVALDFDPRYIEANHQLDMLLLVDQ